MEIVRLSLADCRLLAARAAEHGNSHGRMADALEGAGRTESLERLRLLRRIERRFMLDLGSLCHRYQRRAEATHPLERMVLNYLVERRCGEDGHEELWILVDRVREVREVIGEGEPVGDGRE